MLDVRDALTTSAQDLLTYQQFQPHKKHSNSGGMKNTLLAACILSHNTSPETYAVISYFVFVQDLATNRNPQAQALKSKAPA